MDISNFYNLNSTELNASLILFNLVFSFVLQMTIVYVYKKTRHGLSHSQSFIFTLLIVGTLSTAIMMAVQNNVIGAFAIFAAFTLIRFRTILKESSDLAYVFFSLVVGISVGMSHYSLAIITVLLMSAIIYLFYRFGFGKIHDSYDYLILLFTGGDFNLDQTRKFFSENVESQELLRAKYGNEENSGAEFTLSIKLNGYDDLSILTNYLKADKHIKNFEVLTGKSTSEY